MRQSAAGGVLELEIQRHPTTCADAVGGRVPTLLGPGTRVVVRDVARLTPGASGKLRLIESV